MMQNSRDHAWAFLVQRDTCASCSVRGPGDEAAPGGPGRGARAGSSPETEPGGKWSPVPVPGWE